MLTLKPPIQLAINASMIKNRDRMVERMEANYQVLVSSLHPEILIHFIAGQPEIAIEGDSMTSLINVENKRSTQQINVSLINNVMNRLLLSDTLHMNYQDRVFVDMVLHKIGITDVTEFVHNVSILKQGINNVNELVSLYSHGGDVLQQMQEYKEWIQYREKQKEETEQQTKHDDKLWLHQEIINRLQTEAIYTQVHNFYKSVSNMKKEIDTRELQISEQMIQSQNIVLNRLKNQILKEEEPLEYHTINWYEMGDDSQTNIKEEHIKQEFVEAIMLNAIQHSYALRYQEINAQQEVWYDMLQSVQYAVENTLQRFETYHANHKIMYTDVALYNQRLQEHATNEINVLRQLYQNEEPVLMYKQEFMEQKNEEIEETKVYAQQINYLTTQEENLKQQLQTINQINVEKQEQLQQVIQNLKPVPKLQINRKKAVADAQKMLENTQEVLFEYQNTENIVEHYEAERQRQLEKVMDKNVLKIFETLEKYHGNAQIMPEHVSVNDTALEFLIQDAHRLETTKETLVDKTIESQIRKERNKQKEIQIKSQLEQIIKREPVKEKYVQMDTKPELIHKVTQNEVSEEVMEELRNVNRTITRNVEQYTETLIEDTDTYKSVTNRINHLQLQQKDELTNLIASNVKEQLGNLSDQVYRKLEKRMDSERRRRGL